MFASYNTISRSAFITATIAALVIALSPNLHAQSPLTVQPSTGNVGIGTTNPVMSLDVRRNTTTSPIAKFENTATSGGTALQIYQSGSATPSRWHITATAAGKFKIQDNLQTLDRLYIDTTGYVGIGIATPATALEVVGDITATGNIYGQNKFFQIPHPLDPQNKFLLHASLEGPESAVYYRGEASLQRSEAAIALPEYFEALTGKEKRTVQLTAIGGWSPLYVADEIKDGRFLVRAEQGNPNQRFFWEVKAIRADAQTIALERARPLNRVLSDPD